MLKAMNRRSVFMASSVGAGRLRDHRPKGGNFAPPNGGGAACGRIRASKEGSVLRRVGIFGWGVVAPRSPNVDAFAANLASTESWLEPFNGFGPDNFLVGVPDFRFADYRDWIASRFPPARFPQLEEKMDVPVQDAIGAFIQELGQ